MADQSIALYGRQPTSFDVSTPLANAMNYQIGQSNLQQASQNLQAGQTQLQILNRQNAGQDIAFQNQLIRDAAQKGMIGGADAFDAAMQNAYDRGAVGAKQFIGHYTDLLPSRIFQAYGGAPAAGSAGAGGTAAGGTVSGGLGTEDLDRKFQNVAPERMAQSLAKLNLISAAMTGVRDQQTWQAALQRLQASGVEIGQFAGASHSQLITNQIYDNIQAVRQYLQNRLTAESSGVPSPLVKNETKEVGGQLYGVDPYSGAAKPMTPPETQVIPNAFWPDGSPVLKSKTGGIIPQGQGAASGSASAGGGVSVAEAVRRIQPTENATGNPAAKNPRSSATGDWQFTDRPWLETVKQARPELAKSLNDEQILALRGDSGFSFKMAEALANNNIKTLANADMPITTATVAFAHRFGATGAIKILNAAPNTPMENLVSQNAMDQNPDLVGKTAGQVAQNYIRRVGNDPVATDAVAGAAGRTPQAMLHKGEFDKPQLVETDDGKGGTARMLAQQNNRTGQWVTADEKRAPINANNMVIIPESMGAGGGGRFAGQVMRIMNSAKQATNEIGNLVHLPLESSTGWFGGRGQGPSLFAATKEVLANTVTSQEVQDFNVSMIGMSRSLATLESGGMQTNEALVKKFEGLALKEGDTNWTKMRKLATMRQDAQASIETLMTSPLIGKKQKEFAEALIADLKSAVPWTPNDVTRLQRDKNPTATLGDYAKKTGLGTPGFVEGFTYTDAKGNSAKYKGMGRWEPVAAEAGK